MKFLGSEGRSWEGMVFVRTRYNIAKRLYPSFRGAQQQQYLFATGGWKPEGHKPIKAGSTT